MVCLSQRYPGEVEKGDEKVEGTWFSFRECYCELSLSAHTVTKQLVMSTG